MAADKQIASLEGSHIGGLRFAFNHAGTLLASTTGEGICLWDPLTSRQLFAHSCSWNAGLSLDDRFLPVRGDENKLLVLRDRCRGEYRTLTANRLAGKGPYVCSAISADGRLLAGGKGMGPASVFGNFPVASSWRSSKVRTTLSSGNPPGLLDHGAEWPVSPHDPPRAGDRRCALRWARKASIPESRSASRKAGGHVLASAQFDCAVVRHIDQPDRLIPLGPHPDVRFVAVSPDGQWVATGGFGHREREVWEARTGKLAKDLSEVGPFCRVVFSPDGKCLLTDACFTRQIRAWQVGNGRRLPKEPFQGICLAFAPDGKLLVVESGNGVACLYDPRQAKSTPAWKIPVMIAPSISVFRLIAPSSSRHSRRSLPAHLGPPGVAPAAEAAETGLGHAAVSRSRGARLQNRLIAHEQVGRASRPSRANGGSGSGASP